MEENEKTNNVKIADKDIRIYLGECLLALQRSDQISLSATDSWCEKMRYIITLLEGVGVIVDKEYRSLLGKIIIKKEVLNGYRDNKSGKLKDLPLNVVGLTKVPELFMYTKFEEPIDG